MASQSPAETITTEPITAKIETIDTRVAGFASVEFEILWINFIVFLHYERGIWNIVNLSIRKIELYG